MFAHQPIPLALGLLVSALLSFCGFTAMADPNSAESIVSGMSTFKPGGDAAAASARFSEIVVTGQPFEKARRAQTIGSPANRWDVMLQAPFPTAVKQGDVLLIRFWVRAEEAMAADGLVGMTIELNRDPWEKLVEGQYAVPRHWTRIEVPFTVRKPFDAGSVNINLRLGYPSQTIDIGGFELTRLPPGTRPESLAKTTTTYRGIEPDAPWRKAALDRIERLRKADLTVILRDPAGRPLANQPVRLRLKKHAFGFGTAVDARLMLDPGDAGRRYREQVEQSFNAVVYENDLKWLSLAGDPKRAGLVDQTLPWFADRKIDVRGHVLVWPGMKWLPPEVRELKSDPAALRKAINEHITSLVTRYRGRLAEWDVVNEPFTNRDLETLLGREAFVEWFKLARAADPGARLFINDFGILETGNRLDTEHQRHYEQFIQYLLDHGAPLDGIGIQGHFGSAVTDPENMLAILDRFARFGKPIRITELDVNMLDPELRAKFLRDVFIVCFSHPGVDGVMQWGFWEGRHWLPDAALYTRDWSLREHGQAWARLMSEWNTDVTLLTGPDGSAALRGFLGSYEIRTGSTVERIDLPKAGARVECVVKP